MLANGRQAMRYPEYPSANLAEPQQTTTFPMPPFYMPPTFVTPLDKQGVQREEVAWYMPIEASICRCRYGDTEGRATFSVIGAHDNHITSCICRV